MLAEEAKACFSPWSTCWLHSSLEFEKSLSFKLEGFASPSSSGLGHRPFTAVTGVRVP